VSAAARCTCERNRALTAGNDPSGLSVMELIIAIGVLGILIGASVGLFTRLMRGVNMTDSLIETEDSAQVVVALLDRNIKSSREVVSVGGSNCPGSGNTLVLRMLDGGLLTYSLSDGQIASNGAVISTPKVTITNLQFSCLNDGDVVTQVNIEFDAGYQETESSIISVKHYSNQVAVRNL